MTESTQNARPDKPDKPELLGHIQADRPCAGCGFNLFGQVITRDEHYHMPIARCPECGQVAALQEYPGLGVWARRWSAMIAAAWLLLVVAYLAFTLVMVSVPVGTWQDAQYRGLTTSIYEMYTNDTQGPETADQNRRLWSGLPEEWLEAQDIRQRVAQRGSILSQLDPEYPMVVASLWLMIYATFLPWPILMTRARRIKVAIYLGLVLAVGAAFVGVIHHDQAIGDTTASGLALGLAWPVMLGVTYPVLLTAALLAAFTGRPLARALIRATLPPRLRLPFAELWRVDGKQMPAITGK
ncbi:MAG: hypothetical protein ACI89L_001414 [Phycisphaerales bacterium]|jgi:hypothetical protein